VDDAFRPAYRLQRLRSGGVPCGAQHEASDPDVPFESQAVSSCGQVIYTGHSHSGACSPNGATDSYGWTWGACPKTCGGYNYTPGTAYNYCTYVCSGGQWQQSCCGQSCTTVCNSNGTTTTTCQTTGNGC
jgi:hypothetical protein